jgi:glycosyltransferase involved in cell wall biosynthesis
MPFLSLVIPAYNEAQRLPRNIPFVAAHCRQLAPPAAGSWEVLVVVERSTDGTLDKARAAAEPFPEIQVIDNGPQRGKGHAVRSGMLRAKGDIVLFMDADLSTPLAEIDRFIAGFVAHPETDVLIGNRRHPGSRIGRPQGWLRRHLSSVFSRLVKARVLGGDWADTQCGFKAFRARAAREIFSRQHVDGFSFDVEVLALASALGLHVAALPVEWYDNRATRVNLWRDGWTMLRDLWRVRGLVAQSLREQPPS